MFPLNPFLLEICSWFSDITTYRGMVQCEAWSLTLPDRLSVFKNRVLRKAFEYMQEEVRWELRKQHSKLLHTVHCSPNMISEVRYKGIIWVFPVAYVGEERYVNIILEGKTWQKGTNMNTYKEINYIELSGGNSVGRHQLYSSGCKWRSLVGSCELSIQPLGSIQHK